MSKKSIIISQHSHKDLKVLANSFNSPLGGLIEAMILYFKRTGINPLEGIKENPSSMIKVLDKRIVSFLRVQERDILKPMRDEVFLASKNQSTSLEELTENLQNLLSRMNNADQNRTSLVHSEIRKMQQGLVEIASTIDSRGSSGLVNSLIEVFNNADI
ncbi:hypothetical protein FEE95_03120 [Maribacter algarum]|uniref:Uncharacterized protein n=1 Tax=Maribacter algarum (ex Zhang et al. 2020) TaxID=2578118 RepID=A0A5S3PTW0_9FLAO|nr:BfmA/BtgA family mobilization protein [Maribacter algarum]TMM58436.1 hypothetical protein FEE95_03120 [Maribacter algarum]